MKVKYSEILSIDMFIEHLTKSQGICTYSKLGTYLRGSLSNGPQSWNSSLLHLRKGRKNSHVAQIKEADT